MAGARRSKRSEHLGTEGDGEIRDPISSDTALPALLALGRARTHAALAYLAGTVTLGLLASGLLGYAFFLFALSSREPTATGPGPSWIGCWALALTVLGVSVLMLQRKTEGALRCTSVTDRRVLDLVQARTAAFLTFAPDSVQIAFRPDASVVDGLTALTSAGRRHVVLPASLLSVAAEPLLIAALEARLARVAGASRLDVWLRSRAELLHEIGESFRPASGSMVWFVGLGFRLVELFGFGVLWLARTLLGRWFVGRARVHDESSAAEMERVSPALQRSLTERAERFDAYVLSACRGVLAFKLLPTDATEGFERWLARSGADRSAVGVFADDLSIHLTADYDAPSRDALRVLPWAKLGRRALEVAIRAEAALVARQLTKRRRDVVGAAASFGQLVESLEAGAADEIARRLDPALVGLRDSPVRATRYNGLLFVALESLLVTALLDRGARLVDPLRSGSIAVRQGTDVIDVQAIVVAGMRDADGAAELRAWTERLQMPAEPTFYREAAEPSLDVPREAKPFVPPTPGSPGHGTLLRANAARSTAVATFLALCVVSSLAAVPFGLLLLQLGYRWLTYGGGAEPPHPLYPPLDPLALWYVPAIVVVVALLGLQSPPSSRRTVEGAITQRLRERAAAAAVRHRARPAARLLIVADDPRRPQVELVDHVASIFGRTERRLLISDAVVDVAWEGDLEDALDRAFATVAGNGALANALLARARCVTALATPESVPGRAATYRRRFLDWLARLLASPASWVYGATLRDAERAATQAATAYADRRDGLSETLSTKAWGTSLRRDPRA